MSYLAGALGTVRRFWIIGVTLLAGCTTLTVFDAVVPKDRDGVRIGSGISYAPGPRGMLDVYAPRRAVRNAPVIVFFYGGSWNSGTRKSYAFVGRALAARGFVVVIPDYRLVPKVRFPAFVEDGAGAVVWTEQHIDHFGGDPGHIVLMGHSAGAYIAAMLAFDERWLGDRRKAVRQFVGLAGPYDFLPFDAKVSQAAFGAWPRPKETQPITWAGPGDPSSLFLVGAEDRTVSPRNSEAMAASLKAAGVSVEFHGLRGVGHVGLLLALAKPFPHHSLVLDTVSRFINTTTDDHR